jgi:hypothetical protein
MEPRLVMKGVISDLVTRIRKRAKRMSVFVESCVLTHDKNGDLEMVVTQPFDHEV